MIKILITEGLGSYNGTPRNKSFHPHGRMGALVQAFKNDILVYSTQNASTLPDSISDWYAANLNDGMAIPCTIEGTFDIYTKMHNGHHAFELGKPSGSVPVIRNDKLSTSTGIDFHYCNENDPGYDATYAASTGCLTVLKSDIEEMFTALGITDFTSRYVGTITIKRSLSDELYETYKGYYPNMIDSFCANKIEAEVIEEVVETDENLQWLVDNKGYTLDYWQGLIDKDTMMSEVSVKTVMAMIRKASE